MKVEIKLIPEAKEPYAVIHASEVTPQVQRAADLLRADSPGVISVVENERIIVLRPDEIYMVRVENEETVIYTKDKRYISRKRLYELEAILGKGFMRISKSALMNLRMLDYVEPTFGGLMLIVLKNKCRDYISRKYLPSLKKYLGL
ncbi:MAG: LytTR family DNA-binding domain-containing protein [Christensenellales bacterium]